MIAANPIDVMLTAAYALSSAPSATTATCWPAATSTTSHGRARSAAHTLALPQRRGDAENEDQTR